MQLKEHTVIYEQLNQITLFKLIQTSVGKKSPLNDIVQVAFPHTLPSIQANIVVLANTNPHLLNEQVNDT